MSQRLRNPLHSFALLKKMVVSTPLRHAASLKTALATALVTSVSLLGASAAAQTVVHLSGTTPVTTAAPMQV